MSCYVVHHLLDHLSGVLCVEDNGNAVSANYGRTPKVSQTNLTFPLGWVMEPRTYAQQTLAKKAEFKVSAPLQGIEIDSCLKRRLQRSAKEGWGCYKPSWLSRVHWWLVPARNLSTFSTLTRQCMVTLPVVKMMSSQAMIVRGGMFVFFVLPPAVLPQFQGVPSWNVYCSRFGNRCWGRICLYVPSLPGFDNLPGLHGLWFNLPMYFKEVMRHKGILLLSKDKIQIFIG